MVNRINLNDRCYEIKSQILKGNFQKAEELILDAMYDYPHNAQPHNLMGILLMKEERKVDALKHFRAAWSLDSTYVPARYNLEQYTNLNSNDLPSAFTEEDCKNRKSLLGGF